MGAKTDSEFLDSRRISPAQARYLLAIANHPSPMFVLGYVGGPPGPGPGRLRLSPLGRRPGPVPARDSCRPLARRIYGYHGEEDPSPAADETSAAPFSFDVHMMGCFETMVKIGGLHHAVLHPGHVACKPAL